MRAMKCMLAGIYLLLLAGICMVAATMDNSGAAAVFGLTFAVLSLALFVIGLCGKRWASSALTKEYRTKAALLQKGGFAFGSGGVRRRRRL